MSVKLQLQSLADWIKESSAAAKGASELVLESSFLQEGLKSLGDLGGLTGALFKLGAKAIPDPTPEQRIASRLFKTFLTAMDREFKEHPIKPTIWRRYLRDRLPEVTTQKLSGEFTWMNIFGSQGPKPGRSWHVVGQLSDLGRTWVAHMATDEGRPPEVVQQLADDVRGRIHEALAKEVDKLQADPVIQNAMTEALSRVGREALDYLAQALTTLKKYRLFGEMSQDAVYISPLMTITDFQKPQREQELRWEEGELSSEKFLFEAIREKHPRLVVLEGEMGVGKSCLMRVLGSQFAEQFRRDRRHAPLYVRWGDVYAEPDLGQAISSQISNEYRLPLRDLHEQDDLVYLIDGFDEMRSHHESYVEECFNRLIKLFRGSCSVVVSMRSTVITPKLRRTCRAEGALYVQVREFGELSVDAWAKKWSDITGKEVTGEDLRALCSKPDAGIIGNPLLLYMLAKYVLAAPSKRGGVTRADLFRTFVEKTIQGKLRTRREDIVEEDFPFHFSEQDYRMLLQEIAWMASWPTHAPRCPARLVRDRIPESFLRDLKFQDIRTAFVLHFFEPGNHDGNEFEFQPDGFRQYLLAEWCMRTQFEALRESHASYLGHPLSKEHSINALAQISLKQEERSLLNEVYEELGRLYRENEADLTSRLAEVGVQVYGKQPSSDLLRLLYSRVRSEAEEPSDRMWKDEEVGIYGGEELPRGLESLRLIFNFWDQCMIATLALFRSLGRDPSKEQVFQNPGVLGRFLRTLHVVRGIQRQAPLNLSHCCLVNFDLERVLMTACNLEGANLTGAVVSEADLTGANLRRACLVRADLRSTVLIGANFIDADLTEAKLIGGKLSNARLFRANLKGADLEGANLVRADLRGATLRDVNLVGAKLAGADLRTADLSNARLDRADLREAYLNGADLNGATLPNDYLRTILGRPRRLPDGSEPLGWNA